MRILTRLAPVMLLAGILAGCMHSEQASGDVGLAAGQLAPNLSGRDTEGLSVKLSDFRGQVVLIDFWTTH